MNRSHDPMARNVLANRRSGRRQRQPPRKLIMVLPQIFHRPICLSVLLVVHWQAWANAADTEAKPQVEETDGQIRLFDGESLEGWRIIDTFDFKNHGKIEVNNEIITLHRGQPATGISWRGELPRSNYEFRCEAKRVAGNDFFCGLTFPVKDEYCTLILGGWGGQVVGLSNIDGFSAIENATTQVIEFQTNQWYRIRLVVLDARITVHLDDKKIIDVDTTNRKFSIWWEQDPVTPLGIVTWNTTGALRKLQLKAVKADGS